MLTVSNVKLGTEAREGGKELGGRGGEGEEGKGREVVASPSVCRLFSLHLHNPFLPNQWQAKV